jgi:hypothetical protein
MTTLLSTLMPILMTTLSANNINVNINDIIILMTTLMMSLMTTEILHLFIIDVTKKFTAVHY